MSHIYLRSQVCPWRVETLEYPCGQRHLYLPSALATHSPTPQGFASSQGPGVYSVGVAVFKLLLI